MNINKEIIKLLNDENLNIKKLSRTICNEIKILTSFLPDNASIRERLWYLKNNTTRAPLCLKCNKKSVKWSKKKFQIYCSAKCSANSKLTKKLKEETNLKKYGVKNPFQSSQVKEKIKQTNLNTRGVEYISQSKDIKLNITNNNLKKYGVKHILQVKEFREKSRQTKLNRYGDENYNNRDKAKKTNFIKYGNENYNNRDKCKLTNFTKYGVEHNWQRADIKENIKQTKLNKYGDKNYTNRDKARSTNLARYGVEHNWQRADIKEKIKCSNLKKYGVKHTLQVKEFRDKGNETKLNKYGNENYTNREKCKETSKNNYHKRFIKISNKIHNNKYGYDKLKNSPEKIDIICPKHGWFKQIMRNHMRGQGCPKCAIPGFSQKAIEWLEYISKIEGLYIQHAGNNGEYKIPETIIGNDNRTGFLVDGYCKETNTCYEFLGDFWHGNPEIYDMDEAVHPNGMSAKECYQQTMDRLKKIKNLGYNIKYIWESDWDLLSQSLI